MDFLLYATFFRVAVIVAGAVFMYFGYQLFLRGVMPSEGTEIGGSAGEVKLTVKNAAPGTCFALFGMLLIAIMVWRDSPEMAISERRADGSVTETRLRGAETRPVAAFDLEAALSAEGKIDEQIESFARALSDADQSLAEAAPALMGLATAYFRDGRPDEAIALVRLVYQFSGDSADTLALMALVEHARGDAALARQIAARLNSVSPQTMHLVDKLKLEGLQ